MSQWVRVLAMQTQGPGFKSPTLPKDSVSLVLQAQTCEEDGDQRTSGAISTYLASNSVGNPISSSESGTARFSNLSSSFGSGVFRTPPRSHPP